MVLTQENTGVETTLQGKQFGLEENVVLYNVLSDLMYTDKISAVVRELSTNAVDVQIEAGNADTPIDVHLPTILEPFFIIRDYGTGLSEDGIAQLYTYGSSTKRDSNLYNGALGLGSKSPFAYTKAFSTTSYFNGVKYMYSVYSENGVPTVAKLGETPTDEPNGLEITIPVTDNDVDAFGRKSRWIYKFFDAEINCNLELGERLVEQEPLFKGSNWSLYPLIQGSWLVMANVAYNIADLGIEGCEALDTEGLVIKVDTGVVQFAASREKLSLEPNTVSFLKKVSKVIDSDIEKDIAKLIGSTTSVRKLMEVAKRLPVAIGRRAMLKVPGISWYSYSNISAYPPDGYALKTPRMYGRGYSWLGAVRGDSLAEHKAHFIFCDVKNRNKQIVEEEGYEIIFVTADELKTKENSKSRFDKFIEYFELEEEEYAFASDYKVPSKSRAYGRMAYTRKPTGLTAIHHYTYDATKNSWEWEEITSALELKGVVELLKTEDTTPTYRLIDQKGTALFPSDGTSIAGCSNMPSRLAKTLQLCEVQENMKSIYVIEQSYSQYHDAKAFQHFPFWGELLKGKSKTIIDGDTLREFLNKFKLDYRVDVNEQVIFGGGIPKQFLPSDLMKLVEKFNNPTSTSSMPLFYTREYRWINEVSTLVNKKPRFKIKDFTIPKKIVEKYTWYLRSAIPSRFNTGTGLPAPLKMLMLWDRQYKWLLKQEELFASMEFDN